MKYFHSHSLNLFGHIPAILYHSPGIVQMELYMKVFDAMGKLQFI